MKESIKQSKGFGGKKIINYSFFYRHFTILNHGFLSFLPILFSIKYYYYSYFPTKYEYLIQLWTYNVTVIAYISWIIQKYKNYVKCFFQVTISTICIVHDLIHENGKELFKDERGSNCVAHQNAERSVATFVETSQRPKRLHYNQIFSSLEALSSLSFTHSISHLKVVAVILNIKRIELQTLEEISVAIKWCCNV